jgi:hypothetical protein
MNACGRRWVGVVAIFAALAGCARSRASLGGSASNLSGVKVSPIASPPTSALNVASGTVIGVAWTYAGPFVNGKMADDGTPGSGIT